MVRWEIISSHESPQGAILIGHQLYVLVQDSVLLFHPPLFSTSAGLSSNSVAFFRSISFVHHFFNIEALSSVAHHFNSLLTLRLWLRIILCSF